MVYENETPTKSNTNNYICIPVAGTPYNPTFIYEPDTTLQGFIHSHYSGLLSIFSPTDLRDLYDKVTNTDVGEGFFAGVVTASGTAYVMQIQDKAAFLAFGLKYLSTEDLMTKFGEKIYENKYGIYPNNSKEANEKAFLKMMKEMNMGTNISANPFVPNAPGNPDLFKNWTPIKYNPTTNNVEPQNCN